MIAMEGAFVEERRIAYENTTLHRPFSNFVHFQEKFIKFPELEEN